MNGATLIAKTMRRLGALHLFSLMGGTNMRMMHHAAREGITLHHFRHENGAVGAADGFARVTGDVGWACVVPGPGFTNSLTALRTAVKASTPIVLVLADASGLAVRNSPFDAGIQSQPVEEILAALGVAVVRANAATLERDVVAAHDTALRSSQPTVLLVPVGLEDRGGFIETGEQPAAPPPPLIPSVAVLDRAERAIRDSEMLVLLAGVGAAEPRTAALIMRLAELTGAHLATSLRGAGLFDDSAANLGISGGFSNAVCADTMHRADCIVVFGASLNPLQTRRSTFLDGAVVVHVDNDPRAFGRFEPAEVEVPGDAAVVAQALVERFEAHPLAPARPLPTVERSVEFVDTSTPGDLDPRAVAAELDRLLPADRTVVIDGGHFSAWPVLHMRHAGPDAVLWPCDFGALGCAAGPSLGAAIARPDRQTVLMIGDCGFYMTLGDLEVAVRERLPLVIACFNDGAAGSEIALAERHGLPFDEAIFGVDDLARVAAGLGMDAATVDDLDEIGRALAGWDRRGPLFLDCRISRAIRSPLYAHA